MASPASDVMTFGSAKEQDVWNRFYPKPVSDTSQVKDAGKVNAITSAAEDIDKTGQAPPVGGTTSTPSEGGAGGVDWDAIESALSSTLNPRNPYGGAGRTTADVGGMLSNLQTWYGGLTPGASSKYGPNLASAIQNVGGIYGSPTEFLGNVERRAVELYGTPEEKAALTPITYSQFTPPEPTTEELERQFKEAQDAQIRNQQISTLPQTMRDIVSGASSLGYTNPQIQSVISSFTRPGMADEFMKAYNYWQSQPMSEGRKYVGQWNPDLLGRAQQLDRLQEWLGQFNWDVGAAAAAVPT